MSIPTTRTTAPVTRRSGDDRLARLLDSEHLAHVVPSLPPETIHQLIHLAGLDACGTLVTLATPAQLTSVLDLDLWQAPRPGGAEVFAVERFGEWLDVLVEVGPDAAARVVATLDPQLVSEGVSQFVRVFDPGTFEPTESTDDEALARDQLMNSEAAGDGLECEIGGYLLRARRLDAWDAIVSLLATLDAEHGDAFHALMQACRRLSNSRPEVDGLDDLLTIRAQHRHDVSVARDHRRASRGYVTPEDARAFLAVARQRETDGGQREMHPIAKSCLRETDEALDAPAAGRLPEEISTLLRESGVTPSGPRALLEAPHGADDPSAMSLAALRRLMDAIRHRDDAAYQARTRELAFLANTLQAGGSVQGRSFTASEASDAAAAICNLGLETQGALADTFLAHHDLVATFEHGWARLHRDVALFATDRLIAVFDDVQCSDADIQQDLRRFQRQLAKERARGTPWLARGTADVLATLDATVWVSVLGLLDECPIVPAALTAVLERRTDAVSPTAFVFVSTAAQIGDIRVFMRMLPHLLAA